MAGLWGAIFTAILGGIAKSSEAKNQKEMSEEQIKLTGAEERKTAGYAAELAWYYKNLEAEDKRNGLKNYTQFSSLEKFAPQYHNEYTPPANPKPVVDQEEDN